MKILIYRASSRALFLIATLLVAASSLASTYPNMPVRLVVPFSPGGGSDILARVIGQKLSEALGQPFVIENRAGGNTLVATEMVSRAKPDGYTLLLQTNSFVANPLLSKDVKYDALRDFGPVSLVARVPHVLAVNPRLPVKTFAELIDYAKSKPGDLNYASAGTGSVNHLAGELLDKLANIKMTHVPYKSSGAVMPDLLAGRVDMIFGALSVVSAPVQSGSLRALAVTTKERFAGLPDVPAISETYPGYELSSWFGILAPAGTPSSAVSILSDEISRALKNPDVQRALADYELIGSTPEEFAAFIRTNIKNAADLIKDAGTSK